MMHINQLPMPWLEKVQLDVADTIAKIWLSMGPASLIKTYVFWFPRIDCFSGGKTCIVVTYLLLRATHPMFSTYFRGWLLRSPKQRSNLWVTQKTSDQCTEFDGKHQFILSLLSATFYSPTRIPFLCSPAVWKTYGLQNRELSPKLKIRSMVLFSQHKQLQKLNAKNRPPEEIETHMTKKSLNLQSRLKQQSRRKLLASQSESTTRWINRQANRLFQGSMSLSYGSTVD